MASGIDIIRVGRIDELRAKERFLTRVFTPKELTYVAEKNYSSRTIAGMFSAKESILKALGLGLGGGLALRDLEILHDKRNKPYLNVEVDKLKNHLLARGIEGIEVSISHDGDYAISSAQLVKEKKPSLDLDYELLSRLPKMEDDFHKADMGKVLIIACSQGMTGAGYLASQAALRTGAGLVYLLVPKSLGPILEIKTVETIVRTIDDGGSGRFLAAYLDQLKPLIKDMDAIAIGPGLGRHQDNLVYLEYLIENFEGPLLIDADGLNSLAEKPDLLDKKTNIYLTPHAMEFSRLSGLGLDQINGARLEEARSFVDRYNVNLLLKGKNSIVINRKESYINRSGNEGMATAGSGDVLTGMALALLARQDSLESLKLACHLHGLAGDLAGQEKSKRSMVASDIISFLPSIMKMLEENL
mgnify:FL=1